MTETSNSRPTVDYGPFTFHKPTTGRVIVTVLLVGLCLALGLWQIQRLQWKENLLAELQEAQEGPKIYKETLPEELDALAAENFRPIMLPGEFAHEHELHMIGRSRNGQPGYNIYTPFRIADDGRMILVNRGWVPQDKKEPADRPEDARFDGVVFVSGFISVPQGGSLFLPDHDVSGNIWFWPEIARINVEKNLNLPPVVLEMVNDTPPPGQLPIARNGYEVEMRNDHLNYALMWFSLSFAGLVIFFIYHLKSVKGDDDHEPAAKP
jgi:surfeit locus 1 family protein